MKLLQINTTVNTTSTGRITEEIGQKAMEDGHESYIAYRKAGPAGSRSELIKIGNELDRYWHGLKTRVFDLHGFGSKRATRELVREINDINPDVIGLHNLHGYYVNIEILFNYLKDVQKPVLWTFHDCWPFTGHCTYFESVNCERWKTGCHDCPLKKNYPASYFLDNSRWNYAKKKELFNGLKNLTIVTPSAWLKNYVTQSFLKDYPVKVIHNGIDTAVFTPNDNGLPEELRSTDKKIVLGVASVWDKRKGLQDFIELSKILDRKYKIVLVGLSKRQMKKLPDEIIGISRTEDVHQLAALYSVAEVFVNPTWIDNFPTTNIEALSCGTPVITYRTGGSPEAIDEETGFVVKKGSFEQISPLIEEISSKGKIYYRDRCRERAIRLYEKENQWGKYIDLYNGKIDFFKN